MSFNEQELSDRFDKRSKNAESAQTPTIQTIIKLFKNKFEKDQFDFTSTKNLISISARKTSDSIQVYDHGDGTFAINHNRLGIDNIKTIQEVTDELADFHGKYKTSAPPSYIPGQLTDEGIYIGRFENTLTHKTKDYFAAPADENAGNYVGSFNRAASLAKSVDTLNHHDWQLPTSSDETGYGGDYKTGEPDILDELYKLRHTGAFNGTFTEAAEYDYLSSSLEVFSTHVHSSEGYDYFKTENFQDGRRSQTIGGGNIRLVRSIAVK